MVAVKGGGDGTMCASTASPLNKTNAWGPAPHSVAVEWAGLLWVLFHSGYEEECGGIALRSVLV